MDFALLNYSLDRYFAAAKSTGVFVTEAKLTKILSGEGGGGMRRAAASRESLDLGEEAATGFSGNFHNLDDARQESAAATAAKGRSSLSMRHRVAKSSSFAAADRDAVQYTCFFCPRICVPFPSKV